jgi:HlyD family secretion protein
MARMGRSGQGGGPAGAAGQMPRGGRRGGGASKAQTVYTLGADKKLTAVEIRTGITDGRFTQVISGNLKPGDTVVTGIATAKVEGPPPPGGSAGGGGGMGRGRRG